MVSYAPTPSTERTVRSAWISVAAVIACTMVSVPARVDKANWWGQQAPWIGSAKCWARLRETTRRSKSPTMIPRTRPFGFCKATTRPRPRAWEMGSGTSAAAASQDEIVGAIFIVQNETKGFCGETWRAGGCSLPSFAEVAKDGCCRKLEPVGWVELQNVGAYGLVDEAGRWRGSCNSSSVLWFLGARGWAVRDWRAAVNSLW